MSFTTKTQLSAEKIESQYSGNNNNKTITDDINLKNLKIFVKTFGCQMNEKDSQRVLAKTGMIPVNSWEEADVVIINTCAVREKPEHKVYSEAGKYVKIKKVKPQLKVGIIGCVAQLKGEEILNKTGVDFVVGTQAIHKINDIIKSVIRGAKIVDISITTNLNDRFESPIPEPLYMESPVKAYVTIQEGCNQFCTFCIVPITRGREVTRPSQDIIKEVKELVSRGVKEVILLGQNVNAYGRNTPGELTFAELLYELDKIHGLERIRFTTSNPRYMDDDLISAMAECKKVCEHLHLPVQSGSNRILKKMGRRHTIEEYIEIIQKIKKAIPGIAITTDIIVGFPGETEKDFEETVELVKMIKYDDIFSFMFSPRPGTAASRMQEQLPQDEKERRLKYLQKIQDEITLNIMKSYVGRTVEILVEGSAVRNPEKDSTGRTRTNKIVNFEGKFTPGDIIYVKVKEATRNSLRGEVLKFN